MLDITFPNLIVQKDGLTPTNSYYGAVAIELAIDSLYLAIYAARYQKDSVTHLHKVISKNLCTVASLVQSKHLILEEDILWNLRSLTKRVLAGLPIIERLIPTSAPIISLISRLSSINDSKLSSYICLVLAIAQQIKHTDTTFVIPVFKISATDSSYIKHLTVSQLPCELNFDKLYSGESDRLWYNLFAGIRLTTESPFGSFVEVSQLLYIDILPSAISGMGLSKFSLLQYIGSGLTRSFINSIGAELFDKLHIVKAIELNNTQSYWIDDNIQTPAVEAVDSEPSEETPDDKNGDSKSEDAPKEETEEPALDDKSDEPKTDEPTDPAPDETGEEPTPNNPPDESADTTGGDDTPSESKPMIFGLDLKLAKNETLDDLLYKLYIANHISNLLDFNHDDLPPTTLTLLKDWKDMYLFLAAATETKKFLKQLKIKL